MNRKIANTELSPVDEESQLSPIQQRVLGSLIAGRSYVDAANDGGITDKTIRRWRESCPIFESALRSQLQAVRDSAMVLATVALQGAIKTLIEIAATPSHPQALKAIQMIIDLNRPLQAVSASSGVAQVRGEQILVKLQRFSSSLN